MTASNAEVLAEFRRQQRRYDCDGYGFEIALNAAKDVLAGTDPAHVERVVLADEVARLVASGSLR